MIPRSLFSAIAAVAVLAVAACLAPSAIDQVVAFAQTFDPSIGLLSGATLAVMFPITALSEQQLRNATTPRQGALEADRHVLFDTATYVDNTTTTLSFFNTARNDLTLSNANGSGQLQANNWFRIFRVCVDFLIDASLSGASNEVGALDDVQKLILVGRPTLTLTLNGKSRIDGIPLSFCHASGGAVGAVAGSWTAPNAVQVANNNVADDGFSVGGAIIIPPLVGYSATITWAAAQDLQAGNVPVRLSLDGIRQRPVS